MTFTLDEATEGIMEGESYLVELKAKVELLEAEAAELDSRGIPMRAQVIRDREIPEYEVRIAKCLDGLALFRRVVEEHPNA